MSYRNLASVLLSLTLVWTAAVPSRAAKTTKLELDHLSLELPGPPSAVAPADLNGDGLVDLAIVVAFTEVDEIGIDRIEGMVQITTVVPALFERREVHIFLQQEAGGYRSGAAPLRLPLSVLSVEPGPPGIPLIVLTDDGLSELRLAGEEDGPRLELVSLVHDPPVMAGTNTFFPALDILADADGDGRKDVFLPTATGTAVYLCGDQGLADRPVARPVLPGEKGAGRTPAHAGTVSRFFPFPEVRELNGDGLPDLLLMRPAIAGGGAQVLVGSGAGRFEALRGSPADCWDDGTRLRFATTPADALPWPVKVTTVRDLDGDGRAEVVTRTGRERGDGFRKEMKDAKRPIHEYRFHRMNESLAVETAPYFEMEAEGHVLENVPEEFFVPQFDDLDGDGREDLVTVTLDFSIWQAVRILTTKRISIGLDFHVWAQQEDGSFREVRDLDLSEKLKLNLNNVALGRFAQFAGDFDGDGRKDFTHLGRGKKVTIHRGQQGCRYSKEPDLEIELTEEPLSLELVRVLDLNGDGRSDIMVARPLPSTDLDETAPVRVDLYVSGETP